MASAMLRQGDTTAQDDILIAALLTILIPILLGLIPVVLFLVGVWRIGTGAKAIAEALRAQAAVQSQLVVAHEELAHGIHNAAGQRTTAESLAAIAKVLETPAT